MMKPLFGKWANPLKTAALALLCLTATACQQSPQSLGAEELSAKRDELNAILSDPASRTRLIAKVFGSTAKAERHAFMKFHVFGYAGDGNLIPFFTMNNYVIQKWEPKGESRFELQHYEVAYYSAFDTDEPIDEWENPLTGEVIEVPHFVLGPLPRSYSPDMEGGAGSFAPDPLNITTIGDRVYIPTLTRIQMPNSLTTQEWGRYGGAPITFWDSMLVYSADIEDVLDDNMTSVPAEMHMQNLVSWAPYLKLGDSPGRTMVRAFGQHINGFDDLPAKIRTNLMKHTPEIFDIENWTETRLDSVELMQELIKQREEGTLDIDQPDYNAPRIKSFEEVDGL